ncbi:ActS/PrrB/RegB family redox-sensitive histidine kinase [Jiella sonneratiae]|uniref:histidine kinase n=1 Tax=Jiella sonneratiae TaxID=2816856 RepID=A0ABS3J860_9HYPH|nr:ActS/PrrB/RegB family redox-sensitive histidine kinase [Jiella sonneratiae]MBO0905852.1 ActS/PrrB/RegB family redox-sensitive histidine kinase [Jiella sonneratiae]
MDQASLHGEGHGPFDVISGMRESQRLRLATLVRLRWLSVAGQAIACVSVAWVLWWPFPVVPCFALIALSAGLNVYLAGRYSGSYRLSSNAALTVLTFDIMQPAGLLMLTGGIQNPFTVFLMVPAVIASATQPPLTVFAITGFAVVATTAIAAVHMPLPWPVEGGLLLPPGYVGGLWFAIVATLVFASVYIYRVAAESRVLADALAATELVLQREQHLSALDGLAAAAAHELGTPLSTIALVAKEMKRSVPKDQPISDDVTLLVEQTERCRLILGRLTSLSSSSESHLANLSLLALIDEVAEPHRNFGVDLQVEVVERLGSEPVARRNAAVLSGVGNLVENAVDFAQSVVLIRAGWNHASVWIEVLDDGPGFPAAMLDRVGDPYMSRREARDQRHGGGLGLGLFIAVTLLQRSGATVTIDNRPRKGAIASVVWPRAAYSASTAAPVDRALVAG